MMDDTLIIDGNSLTLEAVEAVAYGQPGHPRIVLSDDAIDRVNRAADAVQTLLEKGEIAYGITTGFGAFKNKLISPENVQQLQHNILVSHATGVGEPFDVPMTRAIMLIRANTLASGYSGIRVETLQTLLAMLNKGVHPLIPRKGSLGASGDLAPLAHMSLPLIGQGEAFYDGQTLPGQEAMAAAEIPTLDLAAKEGLALTNGTTVMCAIGALSTLRCERLSQVCDVAGCLSLEALNGTLLAFDPRIHQLRPFPRQQECATYLRQITGGSEFTRGYDPTNVQDAYTLRCIPQVHGAARDSIAYARWAFEIELNAVTDNPLIFINEETGAIDVISGGNFHGEPLAIAMDYLAIAMSELGNIAERRIMRLVDEASNTQTLPAFLIKEGGLNSGFMLTQYTAAALANENKVLSHPASVDTIPSSANVEDHVSMGVTASLKLLQIIDNVETIAAIELFAAAQGVDFRKEEIGADKRLGQGTQPAYDLIRAHVPFITQDVPMAGYMKALKELITTGAFHSVVKKAL